MPSEKLEKSLMQPLNILVCEDEALVALDIKERLERLGHRVVGTAANEEDALSLAHDTHPDLALMDVGLAGATRGTKLARILLATLDIPSIFLSAHEEPEIIKEAHEAHPLAYLTKPLHDSDLARAIEFGLDRHRVELALRSELASFKKATHIARHLPKVSSDELLRSVVHEMTLLSGVIGPIAHHINNSLAAIVGYVSMAESSTTLEPHERRFLQLALDECQKQRLFIQRLLWASESGPRELKPALVDTILARATDEIRKILRKGVEISLGEVSPDLRIFADQEACVHAVEGLIINAAQSIKTSGTVSVAAYSKFVEHAGRLNPDASPDTYAVIEVRDSGEGIPEERLEELITFFSTTSGDPKTEGLGLSVAYGVARAHHGWIEIESAPEKGTCVRMFLPILHTH